MSPLIEFTTAGIFCPRGNFYVDPWLPVDRAIITHAHSDHARPGMKNYLCHTSTKPLLQARLGENLYETLDFGQTIQINGVTVSLHPAGHIIGSAQVRIEHQGEVWVASGDYKTENDGISTPLEPVRCHFFITESTFGLPIYKWKPQEKIYEDIRTWVSVNKMNGRASVLFAYSLGKAQRVLTALAPFNETVLVHGAVWNMHQAILETGIQLPPVERVTPETPKDRFKNAIIIAPPGAESTPWLRKFEPYATGLCSGWMQVRGNVRRRNADGAFVLSDHADWEGLLDTITETRARKVFVTHGFQAAFSRYLNETGIESEEIKTLFGTEDEEIAENLAEPA